MYGSPLIKHRFDFPAGFFKIYDFTCSTGLAFDIDRQICEFKAEVSNCDVTAELTTPKPLLNTEEPICPPEETACADGTCLPTSMFCDGHVDCYDGEQSSRSIF